MDNMRRLGKTQSRIRPAFDGIIFPFSSLPPMIIVVVELDNIQTQEQFSEGLQDNGDSETLYTKLRFHASSVSCHFASTIHCDNF